MVAERSGMAFLLATSAMVAAPALAQTSASPAEPTAAAPQPTSAASAGKRSYTPTEFARFRPKTAFDMLVQLPGFTIRSADQERGLGQASENILINGQRIANKSGGAIDELQKIAIANVERIEVVEASSLGIAGLSGEVANVIVSASRKASGQFEWSPEARAHYAKPRIASGQVSYSGSRGPLGYTLSLKNDPGRGAFGGPVIITNADGSLREERTDIYRSEFERPTAAVKFSLDGPGSSLGNLNLEYSRYWGPVDRRDRRVAANGDVSRRFITEKLKGWTYDVSGDYEFALGPGRLKLIGLRQFDHEPLIITQRFEFENGNPDTGDRFSRDSLIGETVGRAEYRWKSGANDWQVSLERAFNSLVQRGGLFVLSPQGEFEAVDFPQGSGKVIEVRYEAVGTWSRALSPSLDIQLAGGGEISRLHRVDGDLLARKFFRPKGSLSLGWRPAAGWDASLKLNRRVGQISFYDFLDQPKLSEDRENSGNPDLVPPQSWELVGEVGRDFGSWGKTRLKTWFHRIDDIIDIIPIGVDGQGVGNVPRATRIGAEIVTTLQFDPIGVSGAKLDFTVGGERTELKDPLTGEPRAISGTRDRWFSADFRHDIAGTDIAWGGSLNYDHFSKYYYLTEVNRNWEGPLWLGVFVEHKNVMGMSVRADLGNLLNARHRFNRTVYFGRRNSSDINFVQRANQLIGPIASLTVKGTF